MLLKFRKESDAFPTRAWVFVFSYVHISQSQIFVIRKWMSALCFHVGSSHKFCMYISHMNMYYVLFMLLNEKFKLLLAFGIWHSWKLTPPRTRHKTQREFQISNSKSNKINETSNFTRKCVVFFDILAHQSSFLIPKFLCRLRSDRISTFFSPSLSVRIDRENPLSSSHFHRESSPLKSQSNRSRGTKKEKTEDDNGIKVEMKSLKIKTFYFFCFCVCVDIFSFFRNFKDTKNILFSWKWG